MASFSDPLVFRSPARQLAVLLALDERSVGDWEPNELRAICEHKWSMPILMPDSEFTAGPAGRSNLPLWTYRDLFTAASPPLQVLIVAKGFGKMHCGARHGPLPREIAQVIYYASIFAAWVRLGQRITTLSDEALRKGAHWGLDQPWIETSTKALFQQAFDLLNKNPRKEEPGQPP